MHIISGILISLLLGLKNKNLKNDNLHGFKNIIEVVHHIKGRIRFIIPRLKISEIDIEKTLTSIKGIDQANVNRISGSLVITYDEQLINGQLLIGVVIHLLGLEKEIDKPVQPAYVKTLNEFSNALNRAVYEKSDGQLDLFHLVPIGLVGLAFYQLFINKKLTIPGAFTLLWWAHNAFTNKGKNE
ncbi:MAG: hypothetical protein MJB14_23395 [Spirochaetes bacterium]|nr:hypothetical protein [Spirochaetota bacterium]